VLNSLAENEAAGLLGLLESSKRTFHSLPYVQSSFRNSNASQEGVAHARRI